MPEGKPLSPSALYNFELRFEGDAAVQASCTEVSGIRLAFEGEDGSAWRVPRATRHDDNLVLKRGVTAANSGLWDWLQATLAGDLAKPIETRTIIVRLVSEVGKPLLAWKAYSAYPVKWTGPNLGGSDVMTFEAIELAYAHIEQEH